MNGDKLIIDYEHLLSASGFKAAHPNPDAGRAALLDEIRKDVSGEYNSNLDEKIERWVEVTRAAIWKDASSVRFYIQAKMLYRDAFYQATIMAVRSVCELICYELLDGVLHPFGVVEEIERIKFRKLAQFLHDQNRLPDRSFELLNLIYDIGNNYVHPKSNQNPKADARVTLLYLGEALWGLFGVGPGDFHAGVTLESAYLAFPDICSSYHFYPEVFASPEAALRVEFEVQSKEMPADPQSI